MRTYPTIKAAMNELFVDCGFNPFLHGGMRDESGKIWKRPTREALAALGYPVDIRR